MTDPSSSASPFTDSYSPQLRTALVLTGTGTAGAYHAGVLRALTEAGVKVDLVAGRGIGVVGALFSAIDGGQRLWDDKGFWKAPAAAGMYPWQRAVEVLVWAVAAAVAIVALPLAAVAIGLVVFPIDFVMKMAGGGAAGLVAAYIRLAEAAFAPTALPTWLPRLVVLVLTAGGVVVVVSAVVRQRGRRRTGAFWWHLLDAPLSADEAIAHCWRVLWDLIGGAAQVKPPEPAELARRYTELLAENVGQPGFRELLIAVHDLDAHRDLIFTLVAESRRRDLVRRSTSEAASARRAEVFDLAGVGRDYLAAAVAGALSVPVATVAQPVTFAADSFWRGETHRLCDRPGSLSRIIDELIDLGVQQILLVSSAADSQGPHALSPPRADGRGRLGEYVQSAEAAILRDTTVAASGAAPPIFTIRPTHNPLGPFDCAGGYDDRSDRVQPLAELITRGYEDAYHQFIEPVVGASGERVAQGVS